MKLVSYRHGSEETFGVVREGGLVEARRRLGGRFASLRAALAVGALGEIRAATAGLSPDVGLGEIEHLPPIFDPGKVLCVGLNYKTHVEETGRSETTHPSSRISRRSRPWPRAT